MISSSQDRPFDTQKLRPLASEITQRRLVTCELSARPFSKELLISSEVHQAVSAFAEVSQKFYAYLASLPDTCDFLTDDDCTLVLTVFSDLLDLSLFYMPWFDQSGSAKDETKTLINELEVLLQSGRSGEAERLSFLGVLVDGIREGQRDAH
jgi:hypothetical protein